MPVASRRITATDLNIRERHEWHIRLAFSRRTGSFLLTSETVCGVVGVRVTAAEQRWLASVYRNCTVRCEWILCGDQCRGYHQILWLVVEHRASMKSFQALRSLSELLISSSIVLRHVLFGLPLLLYPWGFQSNAVFSIVPVSLRNVCPIQFPPQGYEPKELDLGVQNYLLRAILEILKKSSVFITVLIVLSVVSINTVIC